MNVLLYLWIALTIAGLVRSALNLIEAHRQDVERKASGKNGPLAVIARSTLFQEATRFVAYLIAAAVGVAAVVTTIGEVVPYALVAFLALFVVNTYAAAYYTRRLDEATLLETDRA